MSERLNSSMHGYDPEGLLCTVNVRPKENLVRVVDMSQLLPLQLLAKFNEHIHLLYFTARGVQYYVYCTNAIFCKMSGQLLGWVIECYRVFDVILASCRIVCNTPRLKNSLCV